MAQPLDNTVPGFHIGLKMILIANFNVHMVQAGFKVIITQKHSKHTQFSIVSSVLQKNLKYNRASSKLAKRLL